MAGGRAGRLRAPFLQGGRKTQEHANADLHMGEKRKNPENAENAAKSIVSNKAFTVCSKSEPRPLRDRMPRRPTSSVLTSRLDAGPRRLDV